MGNCTAVIKKKNVRPYGRSAIVKISPSTTYATNGETIPFAILGIGNRCSFIGGQSITTPGGHAVEFIPGATDFAVWKMRLRDVATGAELTNGNDYSAQSVTVEVFSSAYK